MEKEPTPTPSEIWKILKEVSLSQKETRAQMQETNRLFRKSKEETDLLFRKSKEETDRLFRKSKEEADRRRQEIDLLFRKSKEEADRRRQETDRKIQENDRLLRKSRQETDRTIQENRLLVKRIEDKWGTHWGTLIEALIHGSLTKLLNEKGIQVKKEIHNYIGQFEGQTKEYDVVAIDGEEIVVVETKSLLSPRKVNDFLEKVKDFKKFCSEFKAETIYGGMAFLRGRKEAIQYAEEKGLFVIRVSGNENATLVNSEKFKPKVF